VLAPEDVDWQKVLESTPTVDSLEKFLQKYANGTHHAEAGDMLEGSYWDKDSRANTAGSYREYLDHFPRGPHATAAQEELAYLDAYSKKDPGSLDFFVSKYGSSRHRPEIDGLRDEAAWQRTNRGDENSLEAYLNAFPRGSHFGEAKGRVADLRDDAAWQRTNRGDDKSLDAYLNAFPEGKHAREAKGKLADLNKPPPPPPPPPDPRKAIVAALDEYKGAYERLSFAELTTVWPAAPRDLAQTFSDLKSATLTYGLIGDPVITGDTAVVKIDQALRLVGKQGSSAPTFKKRLTITLHNRGDARGGTGGWLIDSIAVK
jgi:hypothetical protein